MATTALAYHRRSSFPDAFPVPVHLNIALLAAGLGKRMRSAQPKVLHLLAGRPLAAHVLAAVRTLNPQAIGIVTGHGADAVEAALRAPDVVFVRQDPPRGTGDAV